MHADAPSSPAPAATTRALPIALLAVALGCLAVHVVRVFPFTIDDSYISLRYARNLALGEGLRFNPGEDPAEGCTSLLWVFLTAVPPLLGAGTVLAAKLISIACGAGAVVATFLLGREASQSSGRPFGDAAAAAAAVAFAAWPPTAVHAVSAMETALASLLLPLLVLACLRFCADGRAGRARAAGLLALAAGMTRPDACVVAAGAVGATIVCVPVRDRRTFVRELLFTLVLPGAVWFAARWAWFGHMLPLPFHVKSRPAAELAGLPQVGGAMSELAKVAGPLILAGILTGRRTGLVLGVPAALLIAYHCTTAHWMGYEHRFTYPVAPLLFALAGAGAAGAAQWIAARFPVRGDRAAAATALAVAAWGLFAGERLAGRRFPRYVAYSEALGRAHVALGVLLGGIRGRVPDATLAVNDAGAIPFHSDWTVIDLGGLNDETIAFRMRDPAACAEYVSTRDPDLLVLMSRSADAFVPSTPVDARLGEVAARRGFTRLDAFPFRDSETSYVLWLFADPQGPVARAWPAR